MKASWPKSILTLFRDSKKISCPFHDVNLPGNNIIFFPIFSSQDLNKLSSSDSNIVEESK